MNTTSSQRPIMSTVGLAGEPGFANLVDAAPAPDSNPVRDLAGLWRASRGRRAVLLRGSVTLRDHYRDLLFAMLLKLRRERPEVFISDATWQPGSAALAQRLHLPASVLTGATRLAIRAVDGPHVRYGVLARDEQELFERTWGVPAERTSFTPFPMTLYTEWDTPTSDEGFIFSGGNSVRDYPLLTKAIDGLEVDGRPVPVRVTTTWRPADGQVPANLELGATSHDEFVSLMARCHAMVLPIADAPRSAGQQTYLNAMALGKPVIVTDSLGVRDYIDDGVTGVVVEPTPEALRAAIVHVMDPANAEFYAEMGRRAREHVLAHCTVDAYYRSIVDAMGFDTAGHPVPAWPDRVVAS